MDAPPSARSQRAAAHLTAWPVGFLGVALVAAGVLYVRDSNPYGWFGVGCGAVQLALALAGLWRRDWALTLFGALLSLGSSALLAGIASYDDLYIVTGVAALSMVGLGAALTHQLARLVDAVGRDRRAAD